MMLWLDRAASIDAHRTRHVATVESIQNTRQGTNISLVLALLILARITINVIIN